MVAKLGSVPVPGLVGDEDWAGCETADGLGAAPADGIAASEAGLGFPGLFGCAIIAAW